MKYGFKTMAAILACGVLASWTTQLVAAPPETSSPTAVAPGEKILVAKTFRASKLSGLNVRDSKGEKVGTVDDLVINIESGKIQYVAVSVGATLGVGGKLIAIPYDQMQFDHGKDEMFFVVNVPKEKIQNAPGFDKNSWPNFADPHWSENVDKYYGTKTTSTSTR